MSKIDPELIARRYRAEARFRRYGLAAISVTALFLLFLLADLFVKAYPAFIEHRIAFTKVIEESDFSDPVRADYAKFSKSTIASLFPQVDRREELRALNSLLSVGAADDLRQELINDPTLVGKQLQVSLLMSDTADEYLKGNIVDIIVENGKSPLTISKENDLWIGSGSDLPEGLIVKAANGAFTIGDQGRLEVIVSPQGEGPFMLEANQWQIVKLSSEASERGMNDRQVMFLELIKDKGLIESGLAWRFFISGDSREAELAGMFGALLGSLMTVVLALLTCLPLGVGAAVYLEEFAPKNRLTSAIEVNINNLAAVPSIIFGLLGLAVFLGVFGFPRSTPVVGAMVLALLVLPTIIISARAALRSVPPSIKEAALGVGASHQQAVFHHILPMALPGILTGTILGVARALGETAPLLMVGMVAFIADIPSGFYDAATVLPVQIFLWSDLPEAAFRAKTALTILVLLSVLFLLNAVAIYLRRRFERRW